MNGGTWISNPLFNVAGLYEEETVWPFNATSVFSILHFTWLGSSTEIGLSILYPYIGCIDIGWADWTELLSKSKQF